MSSAAETVQAVASACLALVAVLAVAYRIAKPHLARFVRTVNQTAHELNPDHVGSTADAARQAATWSAEIPSLGDRLSRVEQGLMDLAAVPTVLQEHSHRLELVERRVDQLDNHDQRQDDRLHTVEQVLLKGLTHADHPARPEGR